MTRLRGEDGWALVTGLILMTIMLGTVLSTFAYVDTQQKASADGRKRETAFNLAEAVLNAQTFALTGEGWPGKSGAIVYPTCTSASTGNRCPNPSHLAGMFSSPDIASGMSWSTEVHDNGPSPNESFYSETTTRAKPGYDADGDGKVWIRAQATARGKTRTLIALIGRQEQVEDLPHAVLITGKLDIANNGHKVILDAYGGTSVSGLVAVRCVPALLELEPCLGHKLGSLVNVLQSTLTEALAKLDKLLGFQVNPNVTQTNYQGGAAMSVEARARLEARAIADGTYHATCPTGLPAGQVVYIESGNCSYSANAQINSPTTPGVIIMASGKLTLAGTITYYGVIYHANTANITGEAVHLGGNAIVHGGIIVDGNAITVAGSSHVNIQIDDSAYSAVRSYGNAGLIQNTFREIKGA